MGLDRALLKTLNEYKHGVSQPHFLFSAENPAHAEKQSLHLDHHQVLQHLRGAGYDAHTVSGHYGSPETSIMVHNVSPEQANHLHGLASRLGQDRSMYSTGSKHEMRFHHGDKAGKSHYGEGTNWHESKPSDFYTTTPSGHHFTHNFDFNNLQGSGKLHLIDKQECLSKKEDKICMPKEEFVKEHRKLMNILKNPTPQKLEEEQKEQSKEMKEYGISKAELHLIHYSPHPSLKTIDPKFKGTGVDTRTKDRDTEHPHSFYYRAGSTPEPVVTEKSPHKYLAKIDTEKNPIYDIGHDPHGFVDKSIESNQGALNMDHVHEKIKAAGYHGFYSSKHPF